MYILLLAHGDADANLVVERLLADGLHFEAERVAGVDGFSSACSAGPFDLILADVDVPDTGTWRVFEMARKFCPDVPFILLSSGVGEELIVESIHHGAADFVSKERIIRLVPAIHAALDRRALLRQAGGLAAFPSAQQQAVFRQIAEYSQDIICLHAPDRSIQFVTPSISRVMGYHSSMWLGKLAREFAHPDDKERIVSEIAEAVEKREWSRTVTGRYRHMDGHYVWLETTIQVIQDENGKVVQLISVSRDCTARRRVEEALRRGEQLFEGIAEANRLLLTAKRVMESLPMVLRVLGEAVGADRVVVFELHERHRAAKPTCTLRAEWSRDPDRSLFGRSEFAEITISEVEASREIAAGSLPTELHALFEDHGLLNMLEFPIRVDGRAWGAIGFNQDGDHESWSPAVSSALGIVALNIGQTIESEGALAALADSQRRYEALLAGLSEAVFQIDLEARWRFLNPTWEELTGFRVEESVGRKYSSFIAPDEAPKALEDLGRLVSGRDQRIESELRFLHRLGSEIWLRVMAQPQFDEDGRVIGVSGTLVDVTQRRLAQEAMRASERKFAAVFEASSDAMFLFDRATNLVVECNPRAVELFEADSASELVGTNGASLYQRPMTPAEIERGRVLLSEGVTWTDEFKFVSRRGRVFWGLFSVVRMAPESLGTMLVRVTDISELKDSEERLRASLGEKEVLLKEVYHRVKNNLQIISALLRMQSRRVEDRVAREALENSISRVMAMSMVHEKLYQAQNLVSIDFLSFAQSLVGFLNQLTIGNQTGVAIALEGEPLALSIDQAIPLGLILNELVTNSLKYAFPDGREGRVSISIGTAAPGSARIVVTDNGVGLPDDRSIEEASGLGFRIVRMLVEQLHGELEIETRHGLKVAVRVPPPVFRQHELAVT